MCCYAQQDKVWVNDPDGAPWEVYAVTDDNPDLLQVPRPAAAVEGAAEHTILVVRL